MQQKPELPPEVMFPHSPCSCIPPWRQVVCWTLLIPAAAERDTEGAMGQMGHEGTPPSAGAQMRVSLIWASDHDLSLLLFTVCRGSLKKQLRQGWLLDKNESLLL